MTINPSKAWDTGMLGNDDSICYGNPERMKRMLSDVGYREVEIRKFYRRFYYAKIPVLKQVHERFTALAARNDWALLSTYASIRAFK